jgi:MYXO-CTERM domain-containing protein
MSRQSGIRVLVVVLMCGAFVTGAWADVGSLADTNGQVAAWGDNTYGQLDVPAGAFTAVSGGSGHSVAIRTDGTLAGWGRDIAGETSVPAGTFTAVSAGGHHTLGLRSDGTLAGWGEDFDGQTTVPAGTFTAVAGGWAHSLAIRTDGTLAGWGRSSDGQIDVPSGTFTAVAAAKTSSVGLRTDGTLAGWGNRYWGSAYVPAGTFTHVATAISYGLGIHTDGTLEVWPFTLAAMHEQIYFAPTGTFTGVSAGDQWGLGLRTDGTLTAWGDNWPYADDLVLNVPSGPFVAVEAGSSYGLALRARTSYEDLVVNGNGISDTASWLNRTIAVSGDATIQSTMYTANNPTMAVDDRITLESGGAIEGEGNFLGRFYGNPGSTITATGPMILGRITGIAGFRHDGALNVGAENVLLMDSNVAALRGMTTIAGGQLMSSAGIVLADTGSIDGYGSILGNFTNHGVVTGLGGELLLPGVVNGEGDFLGMVRFTGLYTPGMSPASVTLGDPVFDNTLMMELGGLTQGTEYDHIDILGTATLGGALNVVTIDGFVPQSGNTFDLFDGTLSGTFASVNLPALASGLFWDQSALYTSGILSVYSPGLPTVPVPAPGAAALVLFGLATITGLRRRRS